VGAYLQLFKDLFLIITTGYIVFLFLADYKKALIWYLLFFAFISVLGFNRVIYFENLVIPLMLLLVLLFKPARIAKPNVVYFILFIYMVLLTYLNGLSVSESYSRGTYLFIILLIYSKHLFSNSDYAIKILILIWIIIVGIAFSFLIYGEELLSVSNIDSESRDMILDTGIKGSAAGDKGADLNYFSSGQAIGAVLSIMMFLYRKTLFQKVSFPSLIKQILNSKLFSKVLLVITSLQIWFVFRGLSRGGLFVLIAGLITLIYLQKKKIYILYGVIFLLILFFIMNQVGIIDLLMERIESDETGGTSGRNLIWIGIFGSVFQEGGILQILFGRGIDWPWWEFWSDNIFGSKEIASTHNQWLSIFVNVGLFGLILFLIPIVKAIGNSLKNPNPINNIRVVLFACFFAMTLSLEPLVFTRYTWFIVALAATYTPNFNRINETNQ
jgi:hypothetical protein